ncbi:hypothetical protein [Streptomyces sp. SM12]|uniref:hypothetical protein n=1 Tax=Streptomyces sp. SM12 TaxID=1071602 RepID=UPI000CD50101|nr:hypothetical protein [Streptomyces sp. SM12]
MISIITQRTAATREHPLCTRALTGGQDLARCDEPVKALLKCPTCGDLYFQNEPHPCNSTATRADLMAAATR